MLDNPIGRSPKAWGLGQNPKICFPPARGAYFSRKCGQNAILGGVVTKGSGSWGGASRLQGAQILCFFFLTSILYRFVSKKSRKNCENQGFLPPKTLSKPFKNPSKIDVCKNMRFSSIFLVFFVCFYLRFLKNMILLK